MSPTNISAEDFRQEIEDLNRKLHLLELNDNNYLKDSIIACRTGLMNLDKCSDKKSILNTIRESLDTATKQKPHLELVK